MLGELSRELLSELGIFLDGRKLIAVTGGLLFELFVVVVVMVVWVGGREAICTG